MPVVTYSFGLLLPTEGRETSWDNTRRLWSRRVQGLVFTSLSRRWTGKRKGRELTRAHLDTESNTWKFLALSDSCICSELVLSTLLLISHSFLPSSASPNLFIHTFTSNREPLKIKVLGSNKSACLPVEGLPSNLKQVHVLLDAAPSVPWPLPPL